MAILSITFHTEEQKITEWEQFLTNEILPEIKAWQRKFILSEVETEMLSEGKNTNLLLFFTTAEERIDFLEQTFPSLSQKIITKFQDKILIFKTFLNSKTIKID